MPEPPLISRLRAALGAESLLRLAVLFGSQSTRAARTSSDVDIGIIPLDTAFSLHDELALAARLSGVVGLDVDLVRLDADNPLLGREVARDGIVLFETEPGTFAAYRARAMVVWMDFEEAIAPHRTRFLQRLSRATSERT